LSTSLNKKKKHKEDVEILRKANAAKKEQLETMLQAPKK